MPFSGSIFLINAAGLSGLPPFCGFVSEFLIYYAAVNILIACSGNILIATLAVLKIYGELAEREVVHLYCTASGGITEEAPHFTGLDEITDVYEHTGAQSLEELKQGGIERLKELRNAQTFSASVDDYDVQIGDIVGGVERVTGIRVAEPVTNIIFKISSTGSTSIEYKVGENT